jgi:hypothetical protein
MFQFFLKNNCESQYLVCDTLLKTKILWLLISRRIYTINYKYMFNAFYDFYICGKLIAKK